MVGRRHCSANGAGARRGVAIPSRQQAQGGSDDARGRTQHHARGRARGRRGAPCRGQSAEPGAPSRGGAKPARRQHPQHSVLSAVPGDDHARRGGAAVRPRRSRLSGLPRRVHGGPLRPFRSGDPCRDPAGAGRRHRARRAQPLRGRARAADVRALPLGRPGALLQLRHRGQSERALRRARRDRAQPHHGVRGRLSRRHAVVREERGADEHPVPLRLRALQRSRADAGPDRGAQGRAGGDRDRADDGRGRLHRRRAGFPRGPARGREPPRHPPDLRRGHDLAAVAGRPPAGPRHRSPT